MTVDSRALRACGLAAGLLLSGPLLAGCGHLGAGPGQGPGEPIPARDAPIYRSAQQGRIRYLEREVERLQADLRQAEEAMVAAESGLRGAHSRADAVSTLAEARIAMRRAGEAAPWRQTKIREGRENLEEAERQFQAGHSGSAIFFASRARRMADTLEEEAGRIGRDRKARFVSPARLNLRAGPSTDARVLLVLTQGTPVFAERNQEDWVLVRTPDGPVGWVYRPLLRGR